MCSDISRPASAGSRIVGLKKPNTTADLQSVETRKLVLRRTPTFSRSERKSAFSSGVGSAEFNFNLRMRKSCQTSNETFAPAIASQMIGSSAAIKRGVLETIFQEERGVTIRSPNQLSFCLMPA